MVFGYPAGAPAEEALIAMPGRGFPVFDLPDRGPTGDIEGVTDSKYALD